MDCGGLVLRGSALSQDEAPLYPLCLRAIPPGTRHHLMPKLKGGAKEEKVLIHAVCYRVIHKTLSEGELARNFSTVEALRADEGLRRSWDRVGKRPPGWRGGVIPRTLFSLTIQLTVCIYLMRVSAGPSPSCLRAAAS